jgi:hypothetical protein
MKRIVALIDISSDIHGIPPLTSSVCLMKGEPLCWFLFLYTSRSTKAVSCHRSWNERLT